LKGPSCASAFNLDAVPLGGAITERWIWKYSQTWGVFIPQWQHDAPIEVKFTWKSTQRVHSRVQSLALIAEWGRYRSPRKFKISSTPINLKFDMKEYTKCLPCSAKSSHDQ